MRIQPVFKREAQLLKNYMDRNQKQERGSTLVEFAFAAPLLLILVLGVVDFSTLYLRRSKLQLAVSRTAVELANLKGGCSTLYAETSTEISDQLEAFGVRRFADRYEIETRSLVTGAPPVSLELIVESELPCWTCPLLFQGGISMPVRASETRILEADFECAKQQHAL